MRQMYARDYRVMADQKCAIYTNDLALIYFIYSLLMGAVSGFTSGLATIICSGPIMIALIMIIQKVFRGTRPQIEDLFDGFKDFGNTFILYLLQSVYVFLWSLLFFIPGIIKSYSYRMAFYLYNDNRFLSADEAITKSREIMDGHKWELFCLELSYIGWILLSFFTCGILLFWIQPKMEMAIYLFYLNITGQELEPTIKTHSDNLSNVEPIKDVELL